MTNGGSGFGPGWPAPPRRRWLLAPPLLLLALAACVERPAVLLGGEVLPGDAASERAIPVVGTDYAFEVDDRHIEAGALEFLFTNEGQDPHEMAIVPVEDGRFGVPITEIEFISPGEAATLRTSLPAGHYAFVCLVITNDDERPQSHMELGMYQEFEIR